MPRRAPRPGSTSCCATRVWTRGSGAAVRGDKTTIVNVLVRRARRYSRGVGGYAFDFGAPMAMAPSAVPTGTAQREGYMRMAARTSTLAVALGLFAPELALAQSAEVATDGAPTAGPTPADGAQRYTPADFARFAPAHRARHGRKSTGISDRHRHQRRRARTGRRDRECADQRRAHRQQIDRRAQRIATHSRHAGRLYRHRRWRRA